MVGLFISLFIGILVFTVLLRQVGFNRLLAIIKQMSWTWMLLALFCYGVVWILRTGRLKAILAAGSDCILWWPLYFVLVAGFAINSILPAKLGEVAMVAFLRTEGVRGPSALAAIVQTRIFDVLALMALMSGSGVSLFGKASVPWSWSMLLGVLLVVLLPMVFIFFDRNCLMEKWLSSWRCTKNNSCLQSLLKKVLQTYQAYRLIVVNRSLFLFSFVLSLVLWFGEIMVAVVIAIGLQVPVTYLLWLFLAVPLANVGKAFPITPGGIGIYEGILATTLHSAGLSWELSVAVSIFDHMLKKIWTLAWGTPIAVQLIKRLNWNLSNLYGDKT